MDPYFRGLTGIKPPFAKTARALQITPASATRRAMRSKSSLREIRLSNSMREQKVNLAAIVTILI
jgi:hypothetical protein